jgi:hypothetical protein
MVLASHRLGHAIMQRVSMLHVPRVPASATNLRPHGVQKSQELVAAVSVCLCCPCIPGLAHDTHGKIAGARVYNMLQTARGMRAKTGRNAGTRCRHFAGRVRYAAGSGRRAGGPAAPAWSAEPCTAAAARAKHAWAWCAAGGRRAAAPARRANSRTAAGRRTLCRTRDAR